MTLEEFLKEKASDYKRNHFQNLETLLNYYNQLPIQGAKQIAVFGYYYDSNIKIENGHLHSINKTVLTIAQEKIESVSDEIFTAISNFTRLYTFVEGKIKEEGEISDMVCYDTALRLGASLKLYPEEVYIQLGAKSGAQLLVSPNQTKGRSIKTKFFPAPLHELEPYHIENFLCIYHYDINKFMSS